jgi:hypothetical protein
MNICPTHAVVAFVDATHILRQQPFRTQVESAIPVYPPPTPGGTSRYTRSRITKSQICMPWNIVRVDSPFTSCGSVPSPEGLQSKFKRNQENMGPVSLDAWPCRGKNFDGPQGMACLTMQPCTRSAAVPNQCCTTYSPCCNSGFTRWDGDIGPWRSVPRTARCTAARVDSPETRPTAIHGVAYKNGVFLVK